MKIIGMKNINMKIYFLVKLIFESDIKSKNLLSDFVTFIWKLQARY